MAITSFATASGGAMENNFTLTVGATNNTTYVLDRTYPAGAYKVTFLNGDSTYDVYAIAKNGTSAGYTKTGRLIASSEFNQLSVLGAAANEIISFLYEGVATAPSSAGDVAVAGAYISSVATTNLAATDSSTVITGGNFAPGLQVFFTGLDAVARAAKSVTRTNSTTATAVRPDTFPNTASPFSVKVVNTGVSEPTGSNAHILSNAVTSGVAPTWVTGASLTGIFPNTSTTITLVATDTDGGPITYSLVSGTLPTGTTLNSTTGVISGTTSSAETTYNFTIRATDRENFYVDRAFSVTAAAPVGQQEFASTTSFTVPSGVTSISAVAVGAGGNGANGGGGSSYEQGTGGGGGSLRYVNNISVTPGESLTVTIGANNAATTISRGGTVLVCGAGGGPGSTGPSNRYGGTANVYGTNVGTGGDGGSGGDNPSGFWGQGTGGGGAGGYSGNGGRGGTTDNVAALSGSGGAGGGGGLAINTGKGGRGGGVGLLGAGTSGAGAGTISNGIAGNGGDGSANTGGEYGGGGGGVSGQRSDNSFIPPLPGGARIIWGTNRSFPSTGTGNL